MFGDEMGTLEVAIGNYTWRLAGNQGDAWRRAVVETAVTTGDRVGLELTHLIEQGGEENFNSYHMPNFHLTVKKVTVCGKITLSEFSSNV